jgi:hypothetical protein
VALRLGIRLPVHAGFPGLRPVLLDALQHGFSRERVAWVTKNPRLTLGAVIVKKPINIATRPNFHVIDHLVTERTFYYATKLTLYSHTHPVPLNAAVRRLEMRRVPGRPAILERALRAVLQSST